MTAIASWWQSAAAKRAPTHGRVSTSLTAFPQSCLKRVIYKLKVGSALIDGEAVVLDAQGRSSFQALQGAFKGAPKSIDYFGFDLLELDGEDLTGLSLLDRKARLKAILPTNSQHVRFSDHTQGNGEKLLKSLCSAGLEGVVSKLATSKNVGARAGSWLKTKCIKRQEFVRSQLF